MSDGMRSATFPLSDLVLCEDEGILFVCRERGHLSKYRSAGGSKAPRCGECSQFMLPVDERPDDSRGTT